MENKVIYPPSKLGMIGGGQLGNFFTIAARQMGYQVTILDPDINAPAARFANLHLKYSYDDFRVIDKLKDCKSITSEFENINSDLLAKLATNNIIIKPSANIIKIAQNRIFEKQTIIDAGLKTVPYLKIENIKDIGKDCLKYFPGILKTATLGYDGKGQINVNNLDALHKAFTDLKEVPSVLEKKIELSKEVSVVLARLNNNNIECFPIAENVHRNGILAFSSSPANISSSMEVKIKEMAVSLANYLNYQGVFSVEFFIDIKDNIYINEVAPRTHNSGHYTLDACNISQFEQQVRAICGLPLTKPRLLTPCCMVNILGDVFDEENQLNSQTILANDNVKLYLYGKREARIGRKMGHFTVLDKDVEKAIKLASIIDNKLHEK